MRVPHCLPSSDNIFYQELQGAVGGSAWPWGEPLLAGNLIPVSNELRTEEDQEPNPGSVTRGADSRFFSQPSLADQLVRDRTPGFRSGGPTDGLCFPAEVYIQADAPLVDDQDVVLAFDGDQVSPGHWSPRGRWRPDLPMGGLHLASGLQFHLILQDAPSVRLRWSDLEADARFEWEAFCYQLAHELCPYWLRVQRVHANLLTPSGRRETIGLVVEDFQQAARSRGVIIRDRPEGSVDLADVLALEVFLAAIGDRDWAFDYDDRGRWRQHNVLTFFDGKHL
jgi:hypothetical protein